jgi:hypothetical protein
MVDPLAELIALRCRADVERLYVIDVHTSETYIAAHFVAIGARNEGWPRCAHDEGRAERSGAGA